MKRHARALGAALFVLLVPAGLAAQQLAGVALGPDGAPLADQTVILHRVAGGGGAMAGTDTTDAQGAFSFDLDGNDQSAYFAALRYDGELYIGPAADGATTVTDYLLAVDPAAAIGNLAGAAPGAMTQAPPQRAVRPAAGGSSDAGALWLVALLALTAAGVFVFTAPRYRRRRTRDALIEVARIENRLHGADGLSAEEQEELQARRDRLKEQLAPQA